MKVPTPKKMTSGNWYINMRLGGESINVTEPTERACIRSAQLIKAEYLAGKRQEKLTPQKLTLTQAIDKYISDRTNILSPATIRNYRGIQNTRFASSMPLLIDDLDQNYWQKAVNKEAATCSAKTLTNSWRFLVSVIRESTGKHYTVKLPQIVSNEHEFLDPDQIEIFIKNVRGERCEIGALLALCSLRRSEIGALRWEHIDLASQIVMVRGSLVYNADEKLTRLDTNKNTSSRRDVPMIPQLRDALIAEGPHQPGDAVVPHSYNAIYRGINRVCKKSGLPEVGIHGLRHSFASLAYHLGIPEKLAMQIGGWSDNQTMHKIYTHIAAKDSIKAQNEMMAYYSKMQSKMQSI